MTKYVNKSPTQRKLRTRTGKAKHRGVRRHEPFDPGNTPKRVELTIAAIKAHGLEYDAALVLLFHTIAGTISGTEDEILHELNHWAYAMGSPATVDEVLEIAEYTVIAMHMLEEYRAPTDEELQIISRFTEKWHPRMLGPARPSPEVTA